MSKSKSMGTYRAVKFVCLRIHTHTLRLQSGERIYIHTGTRLEILRCVCVLTQKQIAIFTVILQRVQCSHAEDDVDDDGGG